jgi:Holliday junction resolvasome RuvABC DNA-binding subunit
VGATARTGTGTVASAANKLGDAVICTQAKEALVGLGWKAPIAQAAVAAARETLGDATTLERLILEALRRCPRPGKPTEGSCDGNVQCAERGLAGG